MFGSINKQLMNLRSVREDGGQGRTHEFKGEVLVSAIAKLFNRMGRRNWIKKEAEISQMDFSSQDIPESV